MKEFKTESKKNKKIDNSDHNHQMYKSPLAKISNFFSRVVDSVSKKKDNSIFWNNILLEYIKWYDTYIH